MEIITINKQNLEEEHICCAIGNDKKNQARANSKKDWMRDRFNDGLIFKRFDQRGKIFIEYMPIEKVWKPIVGKNFMVINCLWVSGQFKGKGLSTQLLEECIKDSKSKKMDGIVVVTGNKVKPFLTDKKFYMKHGFELIDSAPPYFELLALKFNQKADNPKFVKNAKEGICSNKKGFTFIYSNQCPFMEEYIQLMASVCKKKKFPTEVIKLKTMKEAQQISSPFGTMGIYYNGKLITHELMPEKKFDSFIDAIKEK